MNMITLIEYFKRLFTGSVSNTEIFDEKIETQEQPMKPEFKFSQNSLSKLSTVHPDLQRVMKRAISITIVDFAITQGKRSIEDQYALYGQGRSVEDLVSVGVPAYYSKPNLQRVTWTLNSNHISGKAVDVVPYVNGRLEWDDDGSLGLWVHIYRAVMEAAEIEGVKVLWGGEWLKTPDRPHFELV